MEIEHFISLHKILIPNDKFCINLINATTCEINYLDGLIEINYSFVTTSQIIYLKISSINIVSQHIERLLKIKKIMSVKYNDIEITEFLFVFGELIEKYFNYCSICGNELILKGIKTITSCNNVKCVKLSYQTVMNNKVTETYKHDSQVFLFLLNILIAGTLHPKAELAFKPLPDIVDINNLDDLKKILEKKKDLLLEKSIVKIMDESDNDLVLMDKIGSSVYSILKNAISNNYFSMSSRNNMTLSKKKDDVNDTDSSSIKFIYVNYSADIENKFTQKYFLFHGSKTSSWYPIVKNGLKVMSGTELMSNGAVHGKGIYFSDSFDMSVGYSNFTSGFDKIVGVFEVMEDPIKYKKTNGIFVINDDKIILLRTLVVIKNGAKITKDITNYFLKDLPLQKQTNKINVGILKNKRLESEYKKLSEFNFIKKINFQDQWRWTIDFESIKNNDLSIEITFSNYPINPPIIKFISMNVKNNIVINSINKIIMDLTNPANWKIINNLSEIITVLYKCFQESL